MDNAQIDAMDVVIHSFLHAIYNSDMTDDECDITINLVMNMFVEMLSPEYQEVFEDRIEIAQKEIERHYEYLAQLPGGDKWPSRN